jgi:HSP20 family protein
MHARKSLTRWPFDLFTEDFMPRWTGISDWRPAVDMKENDRNYVVTADLPGVEAKDTEIELDRGVLSIRGRRESEERDEKNGYQRVERFEGEFCRRIYLRDAADDAKVDAEMKAGVLTVTIPKTGERGKRRIEVKSH